MGSQKWKGLIGQCSQDFTSLTINHTPRGPKSGRHISCFDLSRSQRAKTEEKDGRSIRGLWLHLADCHCTFVQLKDLSLGKETIYVFDCLIHVITQINVQFCVCNFFSFILTEYFYFKPLQHF